LLCQLDLADVFNVLALRVTNARKKYSEEYSNYEEDYNLDTNQNLDNANV
jgi:hypothetical protein